MLRWFSTIFAGFLAAVVVAGASAASAAQPTWPQSQGDIPADPDVSFGVLDNGLRYAVARNVTPPGQVSVRLLIEAGSMQESADQHAVAHFLEHMAFRGSAHIPDGEVMRTLQRLGLRAGADANAGTGPGNTLYRADLPSAGDLDAGLTLFREIAGDLTLDPKLIDAERPVILAEAGARGGPLRDLNVAVNSARFGDHPFARPTIGTVAEIQAVSIDRLRAFYDAYYRPERAVLIVVGDIDPAAAAALIKARFSDWRGRGLAGGDPPPLAGAPSGPDLQMLVTPDSPESGLRLFWPQPYGGPDLTREQQGRRIIEAVASTASNDRFRLLNEAAGKPVGFINGISRWDAPGVARGVMISALNISDIRRAVSLTLGAERQLVAGGFGQGEIDRVVELLRQELARQIAQSDNRLSSQLAGEIAQAAHQGEVYQSPQQRSARFEEAVRGLTAAEVSAAVRRLLTGAAPRVIFYGAAAPADGEQGLRAALAQAQTAPVGAYVDAATKPWAHTNFGTPGKVVTRRYEPAAGAILVLFANGVRLTVKPTPFATDQVMVTVRVGHGQLDLPRDRVAASDMGPFLLMTGGLTDMTSYERARSLFGRNVNTFVSTEPDAFELTNAFGGMSLSRSADLVLQLQLITATLVDPGWRAEDWDNHLADAASLDQWSDANPNLLYERESLPLLHSGDRRWAPSTARMRADWKPSEAAAFMRPILDHAPLEVIIVGDTTEDAAIAATAATLGALPKRDSAPEAAGLRDVRFPPPTATPVILRHKGPASQALAVIVWPATDAFEDHRQTQAARVLADILRTRAFDELRVRQGKTYSPGAWADFSTTLPGYGAIGVRVETRPEDVPAVFETLDAIAADLGRKPVSADELARALTPRLEAARRARLSNAFWLHNLAGLQTDPRLLRLINQALPDLKGMTPADVQAAARRWLVKRRSWRAEVLPQAPA